MSDNLENNTKTFVKSSDKYEDLHSSGATLIITAIIGFIFLALNLFHILPTYFIGVSKYLFYFVMGGIFLAFFIYGIFSLRKASRIQQQIAGEEDITASILDFFAEQYDEERLDTEINATDLEEGELYYQRYDYIKELIQTNFENIDDAFAEHLVEEVYQRIYE